jgi:hypothetical protein
MNRASLTFSIISSAAAETTGNPDHLKLHATNATFVHARKHRKPAENAGSGQPKPARLCISPNRSRLSFEPMHFLHFRIPLAVFPTNG